MLSQLRLSDTDYRCDAVIVTAALMRNPWREIVTEILCIFLRQIQLVLNRIDAESAVSTALLVGVIYQSGHYTSCHSVSFPRFWLLDNGDITQKAFVVYS
jgi:hypothetical protein